MLYQQSNKTLQAALLAGLWWPVLKSTPKIPHAVTVAPVLRQSAEKVPTDHGKNFLSGSVNGGWLSRSRIVTLSPKYL